MKVLFFAPNGGLSLSTGGGSGFGLRLAEILLEAGHTVTLAGFHALDLPGLDRMHGTALSRRPEGVKLLRAHSFDRAFDLFRGLPMKLSAYNGLAAPAFGRWIDRTLATTDADLVVFQDDVPKAALPYLKERPLILYVHYPFLGLSPRWIPPLRTVLTGTEWANDRLLARVATRLILPDPGELARVVWTNSTITQRVVSEVWPSARPVYAPTYLDPSPPPGPKAPLVLSVGAIQPAKNYELLVDAFARVRARHPAVRLVIAGHARDSRYARRLRRHIASAGLSGVAEVRQDVSRSELTELLDSATVQVHPAVFEPFGRALLEGMGRGAIGVANRTEYAGGWVDILDRGTHGLGFGDADELAARLGEIFDSGELRRQWAGAARRRSESFSRERLREQVLPMFR